MSRSYLTRAARANIPFLLSAAVATSLTAIAPLSRATSSFTAGDDRVKQIFCDVTAIKGQLSSAESRYLGSGNCIELESPQKPDNKSTRTSEFPRVNESTQLFSANWTSQATYNPVTKETWEKLTMPAPSTDEKSPLGRPYGNYETRMICATDPWLTGIGVNCTGKTVKATGNLGDAEELLRKLNLPLTTPRKPAQLEALVAAHDREAKLQTRVAKVETTTNTGAIVVAPKPSILEPREGGTYPPQTPLRIRIAPAKNAKDTAYRIEIQAKVNFAWVDVTTLSASAAVAQSPQGDRDWGGAHPGVVTPMTATVGDYRLRARATAPQAGQPGDWVEFRIDGQPGIQVDAMNRAKPAPSDAGGGAAQSAASRLAGQSGTAKALANQPAVAVPNKADAASLNPQPLPPKTSPAALAATPLEAARNKAGAVLLNPQPLPPKAAPGSLAATPLPGGAQQAPSSLR